MYRIALSVVELRFGAFYWVGMLAEISPDGEIAARFNLNAREIMLASLWCTAFCLLSTAVTKSLMAGRLATQI